MPTPQDLLVGRLAIKHRLVEEAKVRECIALLQGAENGKGLGEVLVAKGYLSAGHLQALLKAARAASEAAAAREPGRPAPPGPGSAQARPAGAGGSPRAPGTEAGAAPQPATPAEAAQMDFSRLSGGPLDAYLVEARRLGASDLHFQVDSPPFIRIHGSIVYLRHPLLTPADTEPRIFEILSDAQRETFIRHNDIDFCYEAPHGRYRASVARQRKGIDAVFRVIPSRVPTVEELHLPQVIKRFTEYRQGIVLITGPAGSGKTATMAALIDIINEKQHDHIVTVEEPIEYIIDCKNCSVSQRNVRVHTDTFATALRSAMRADPDYICVGEMRDLETMSMAITAAETGHLVFGTLHTTNAVRSVDRLIDVFPPKEQDQIRAMVSESMRGVISQQLLPRADGRGREPALEIMFATPAVANMIRERKTFQLPSVLQTGSRQGMVTMDDSIQDLLKRKLITKETARFHAESPDRFA